MRKCVDDGSVRPVEALSVARRLSAYLPPAVPDGIALCLRLGTKLAALARRASFLALPSTQTEVAYLQLAPTTAASRCTMSTLASSNCLCTGIPAASRTCVSHPMATTCTLALDVTIACCAGTCAPRRAWSMPCIVARNARTSALGLTSNLAGDTCSQAARYGDSGTPVWLS